jgi:hypothetical protein
LVLCEQRLKGALVNAPVLGVDETGLRVNGTIAYVHVARTADMTHYAYDGVASENGKYSTLSRW